MIKIIFTLTFFFFLCHLVLSQESIFKVEISSDSILMGNYISLKYSIENLDGQFIAPDFEGFRVISGPNVSYQFSMINGTITQRSSRSYHLLPLKDGELIIEAASIDKGDGKITLDPITLVVLPNPDGHIDNPGSTMEFRKTMLGGQSGIESAPVDTLSEAQKLLRKKLKKGKKYKI